MSIIKDIYYGEIDMQDTPCTSERYRAELEGDLLSPTTY